MATHPEPPRTVLGLCAGIGGLELGAAAAVARLGGRLRGVGAVERQAYPAAVLVARMEDASLDSFPIADDIKTFDGVPFRDRVDLVVAGVPCQPFSVAGEQRGLEDERWIWNDVWRIVREVRPRFLLVENVPGFRSKGLPAVLGTLAEAGWAAEWVSLSAAAVGAPHLRERVFCLAADPERIAVRVEQGRGAGPRRQGRATPAHHHDDRLQGVGRSGLLYRERQARGHDVDGCRCSNESGQWDWELAPEPAFCRMDDELPHELDRDWADRIHALGNAVVPKCAEEAFLILWDRIHDPENGAW